MKISFIIISLLIIYTWIGYAAILVVISSIKNKKIYASKIMPPVTVILAVYNEEGSIKRRIRNILDNGYPEALLEIIIASDGSTDRTADLAREIEFRNLKIIELNRQGKALTHNSAIKAANNWIVVFTDADTVFKKGFLEKIVGYFADRSVGCVVGNLIYINMDTSISSSEGIYWKLEKKIRGLESDLGILATATGACMAVRKELWRKLTPNGDSDFITSLDVILQGYRVVHAFDAIAFDTPTASIQGELRTRVRQTSKNLTETLKRWGIKGCIEHPIVSLGLLSHKIFKWLTPYFMLTVLVINILILKEGLFYRITFFLQVLFYLMALSGLITELLGKRISLISTVFSFCVAIVGMGMGVMKGIVGKAPDAFEGYE